MFRSAWGFGGGYWPRGYLGAGIGYPYYGGLVYPCYGYGFPYCGGYGGYYGAPILPLI